MSIPNIILGTFGFLFATLIAATMPVWLALPSSMLVLITTIGTVVSWCRLDALLLQQEHALVTFRNDLIKLKEEMHNGSNEQS